MHPRQLEVIDREPHSHTAQEHKSCRHATETSNTRNWSGLKSVKQDLAHMHKSCAPATDTSSLQNMHIVRAPALRCSLVHMCAHSTAVPSLCKVSLTQD